MAEARECVYGTVGGQRRPRNESGGQRGKSIGWVHPLAPCNLLPKRHIGGIQNSGYMPLWRRPASRADLTPAGCGGRPAPGPPSSRVSSATKSLDYLINGSV